MALHHEYKYTPLSCQENIRLVRLISIENEQVCCSVREYPFSRCTDDSPEYTAISYCWGNSTRSCSIVVNGTTLAVTVNMDSMLRQFVKDGLTLDAGHFLWIDALSINQDDLVERGHQLPRMRHIFSRASKTLAWLGEQSIVNDSDLAMKYAADLADNLRKLEAAGPSGADISSDIVRLVRPDPHPYGIHALGRLLERPWFLRVWVIQEIALSKNITVACGNERADWEDIATCVMTLFHNDLGMLLGLNGALKSGTGNTGTMQAIRQVLAAQEDGLPLETLLGICENFRATDPRDFVLGMEGMIREKDLARLSVDYEHSVEQVFQSAMEICLSSGYSYRMLVLAGLCGRNLLSDHQFPSWVPDFSSKTFAKYADIGSRVPRKKSEYCSGVDPNDNSSTEAPTFSGRLMTVTGAALEDYIIALSSARTFFSEEKGGSVDAARKWVREVVDTAQRFQIDSSSGYFHGTRLIFPSDSPLDEEAQNTVESIDTVASNISKPAAQPSANQVYESLWRTLCADQASDGARAPDEWHEYFESWEQCLLGHSYDDMDTMSSFWNSVRDDMSMSDAEKQKALDFAGQFGINTTGRRFCVTAQGRFGLVPYNTELGDDVAVIVGAEVPYVVRRSKATEEDGETRWIIVGSAFIHSIMYGEELEAAKRHRLVFT